MKEEHKEYKFIENHRYSLDGIQFTYSLAGDVKSLPVSRGEHFISKGKCELHVEEPEKTEESKVEAESDKPENKMLKTEKETKAPAAKPRTRRTRAKKSE